MRQFLRSAIWTNLFVCLLVTDFGQAKAEVLSTRAPIAFLVETKTGSVLYSKDGNKTFEPAGLTRIVTAATVFQAIKDGEITEETPCKVSEYAWRTGGAPSGNPTMFAELGSEIPVLDLLKGLLVHQAHDAAIILAECLNHDEAKFTERMNGYVARIGLTASRFDNPAGMPAKGAVTTAEDMAALCQHMLHEYADRYPLFSIGKFTWNGIFQRNRNPIMGEVRGLDGFGVGSSETDGFAAAASLIRDGRRVIAIVAGTPSAKARAQALKEVVDGAWELFSISTIFSKGETIAFARVHGGQASEVPLVAASDISVLLPKAGTLDYRLRVSYQGPVQAPVEPGQVLGELIVLSGEQIVHRVPLETGGERIERGDLFSRATDGLQELLFGWL
ncbi:D-alanyl-D-alanine carboxypeptidase family protein [Roseibium sediminis]|uniref:D-alanyl-D-alanine carboxypeptidase family protein n=1 Tax=Roseibium sediminis TaxID=1775174 RepID=UPI00123E2F91|nr:D-alanyl-D-alanine carboxypeptidase family protein [Roseibium sediminis]